ncbi:MAG: hypothetical protein ACREMA_04370 [Longimicrobiales bacterium]
MDDLFGFIIFALVFVLGPIIEQIRRKQQRPPPQQQPPAEMRPPTTQQRAQLPTPPARRQTEDASAATMLPDELWEVLTGQPRPRPAPQPAPAPDVESEETPDDEEFVREDVDVDRRWRTFEEADSLEELPRREEPIVVSMETVPEPRARHVAFHQKVQHTVAPVVSSERRLRRPVLVGRDQLRNAVLLQTILGKPKALE